MIFQRSILVVLLAGLVWPVAAVPAQSGAKAKDEENPVKLQLEIVHPAPADMQKCKLKLTATNQSSQSIVIDKKLTAGFTLWIQADTGKGKPQSLLGERKELTPPEPAESRKRLVAVAPGKSVVTTLDLSQPI